jgi:hypothetical protein
MEVVGERAPVYAGYSYRERSDRYTREFSGAELGTIRGASGLVRYSTLSEQIRTLGFTCAELYVKREKRI